MSKTIYPNSFSFSIFDIVEYNFTDILKKYWGYEHFRPLQEDIIQSVAKGNDTLGLLPTGGGKSITFQVPALAKEGICLVVTPLIALMKDQVENLKKRGIKALAIHSGLTPREVLIAYDNAIYGDFKFLYLSPERLSTELFVAKLPHLNVNLLAIDEAHCISQWGYDFRPSYLKISDVRELLPNVPVLAITATATPHVAKDIQEKLLFKKENLFQKSFERENLTYVVRNTENKEKELLKILNAVNDSAIVYVRNRRKTKEYAEFLQKNNISANYFHAGLSPKVKDKRQADWVKDSCRVIVTTNAFGMGIDKPNVRTVVHMDSPDSLEAYFQEAGRAGRDEKRAYAVLLWSPYDKRQLNRSVTTTFPDLEVVKRVYEALCNYLQIALGFGQDETFDFNIGKFCKAFGFNSLTVYSALKILQRAGYIEFSEEANLPSKVMVLMNSYELDQFQQKNPKLDLLLKTLLRSYTGLFTEYATIDEEKLAQRTSSTHQEVYEQLKILSKLRVLHYIPQRRTPLIYFTQDREATHRLSFPPMVYKERLKQYQKRVNSVIEYATSQHICRSVLLLRYFGQKQKQYCGHCDVCITRKQTQLTDSTFQKIENEIKTTLKNQPTSAKQLAEASKHPSAEVWKVIHWLEDVNIIQNNEDDKMEWINE